MVKPLALLYGLVFFITSISGQIATDFTATDIDGYEHNLYTYLNAGKVVILDYTDPVG